MWSVSRPILAALVVGGVLVPAGAALAGYATAERGIVDYQGDDGRNEVTIAFDGSAYTIRDSVPFGTVEDGCPLLDPNTARCTGSTHASFAGMGGDDVLTVTTDHPGTTEGTRPPIFQLSGGPGADVLTGSEGIERITGHDGDDRVTGGAGDDGVGGGAGADVIDAGPGDDVIYGTDDVGAAADTADDRDTITCGPGSDRVEASASDSVAADCERVVIAGQPEVERVRSTQDLGYVVSRGMLVPVECSAPCTASAQLLMPRAAGASARAAARFIVIGSEVRTLRSGGAVRLRVRVNAEGRRRLRGARRVRLTLRTKVAPRGGKAVVKRQRVTLKR